MIFQKSATNFFHCFSVSFLPVLYTVVSYPNTWLTRSLLARSGYKSNKIYNKIQNIWFLWPTYSVLQLPKQCPPKKCGVALLLSVCIYMYSVKVNENTCFKFIYWGNKDLMKKSKLFLKLPFFSPLLIPKGLPLLESGKMVTFQKKIVNDRIFTQQNRIIIRCQMNCKENIISCNPFLFGI